MDEVLAALDIEKYRHRFPKELSGGQQQRVAIARAMIKNPKLLLCDELTGALDTKSSRSVLQFVEKMNHKFGTTVVIITHNEAIAGMADQVIRLKDGQIFENCMNEQKIPAAELAL
jgi:putative ABC transport system ATP-binding protein